jgi:hypothetical protein
MNYAVLTVIACWIAMKIKLDRKQDLERQNDVRKQEGSQ